jgi:hypothetical protein
MIRYYTAAEIRDIYRRPLGTVHRLASERGWRRANDGRRPALYNADDVEATMDELAGEPETSEAYFVLDGEPVKLTYPTTTTVTYELIPGEPLDTLTSDEG